jgi:hypothetical protein
MQSLSLSRCFEAASIGMILSFSVTFTQDMSLFFYYDDYSVKKIFDPMHVYISSLLGSYCYILCYKNIEKLFITDYFRTNLFDWKLSFETFYMIGFFYSTIIFYLTELICYFLSGSSEYLFHRILLITPSSMFVLSLFETFLCLDSLRVVYVNRIVQD